MKKSWQLLFFSLCYSSLLWNVNVWASHVQGMPQPQNVSMNTAQTAPISFPSAPQGQMVTAGQQGLPNNVSNIDVMGAAHQAKTAISAFIIALNNWEEAQTAAGLLPNNTNLPINANSYLKGSNSDEEKEIQETKTKKKKKDKKAKKDKKKKKKKKKKNNEEVQPLQQSQEQVVQPQILQQPISQIQPIQQQVGQVQQIQPVQTIQTIQTVQPIQPILQQNNDWKNVVPSKITAIPPGEKILLAKTSTQKSYRLSKENREEFRKELDKYRGIKKEGNPEKA